MSLVDGYKDLPVVNRYGAGSYTYKCVLDTPETGVKKYEIFANNVDEAMWIIGCQLGNVLNWSYVSNDIVSLVLDGYSGGTCLLYM